jgi:hypothetical protein
MAQDVVDVRIYQGIHFRSADEVARRQGKRSADWAVSHVLRPIHWRLAIENSAWPFEVAGFRRTRMLLRLLRQHCIVQGRQPDASAVTIAEGQRASVTLHLPQR